MKKMLFSTLLFLPPLPALATPPGILRLDAQAPMTATAAGSPGIAAAEGR